MSVCSVLLCEYRWSYMLCGMLDVGYDLYNSKACPFRSQHGGKQQLTGNSNLIYSVCDAVQSGRYSSTTSSRSRSNKSSIQERNSKQTYSWRLKQYVPPKRLPGYMTSHMTIVLFNSHAVGTSNPFYSLCLLPSVYRYKSRTYFTFTLICGLFFLFLHSFSLHKYI